ncbi:hypothetical protein BH11PLA2_BH11PLA2_50440 [soil metagenome]
MSNSQTPPSEPLPSAASQPLNPESKLSTGGLDGPAVALTLRQTPDPPMPSGPPSPERQKNQRVAAEAEFLGKQLFSSQLAEAMVLKFIAHPESFVEFHDQLMEQAGNPTDPIERMQIEQLVMAHFRIGALHIQAAKTESIEGLRILNGSTARLMAEFRKLSIALQTSKVAMPNTKRRPGRLKIVAGG